MSDYRVVHINTPYQIVLDCGVEQGIKMGDKFLIYSLGPVIKDHNDEELEKLEVVKGRGEVTHIQQSICTIDSIKFEERPKTIKKKKHNNPLFGSLSNGETEETEIIRDLKPFENVEIGDYARKIR